MNKYKVDLHIHTVISPCGDIEMSPARIIQLASDSGIDIIGITDHNSTLHCELTIELGKKQNITVIPGCEITSIEEVHSLCLFENIEKLNKFQKYIEKHQPNIPNNPSILGWQVVVDQNDNIIKHIDNYLGQALDVSIDEIEQKVHELNGLFIPAHVDRPQNSLFSQLGFLPETLKIDALQISKRASEETVRKKFNIPENITVVKFSDSHFVSDFGNIYTVFEMKEPSFSEIKKALHKKENRNCYIK